jgi:hypothetical protein
VIVGSRFHLKTGAFFQFSIESQVSAWAGANRERGPDSWSVEGDQIALELWLGDLQSLLKGVDCRLQRLRKTVAELGKVFADSRYFSLPAFKVNVQQF